jgi:hypothetical protein
MATAIFSARPSDVRKVGRHVFPFFETFFMLNRFHSDLSDCGSRRMVRRRCRDWFSVIFDRNCGLREFLKVGTEMKCNKTCLRNDVTEIK